MEAICKPLAGIGCEDVLHVTQPRFKGGLDLPISPRIRRGRARRFTSLAGLRTSKAQSNTRHTARGKHQQSSSQQAAGCQNAASEALAASREGFVMCHAACLLIQTLPLKTRPAPEIAGAVTPRAVTPWESKQRRPAPPAHAVFNSSLGIKLPPVPWLGGRCR